MDLQPIAVLSYTEDKDASPRVSDAVHIGGLKTSDPRFGAYTSYSGCLSSKWTGRAALARPSVEGMIFGPLCSQTCSSR